MVGEFLTVALACALAAVLTMVAVGFILRRLGRVAAMDVLWGPLVLVLSLTAAITGTVLGTAGVQVWILLAVIALWAWRLARHIASRFGSDVEDPRYEELMAKPAAGLLRSVLLPQGAVAWLISLPVQAAAISDSASWPVLALGVAVSLAGLAFETVADRQLERFRRSGGPGRIMDQGLWSWSRHPNYFGESVIWWGIWIASAAARPGLLTVISPVLMTFVLVKGTGIRIMEKHMQGREGWREYADRTSVFFPAPPRRPGQEPGRKKRSSRGRWLAAAGVAVLWLLIAGATGPLAGKLSSVQTNDEASFLPAGAEATRVAGLERKFNRQDTLPAIVVYAGPRGQAGKLKEKAATDARAIGKFEGIGGSVAGPIRSRDGKAVELIVPLRSGLDNTDEIITRIRGQAAEGLPAGAETAVTGPAAFTADLTEAFAGIDGILLLVAVSVVLIILILVYRSPILPFVVLASALFALAAASGAIYLLADRDVITLNGQSQGILFILVVGAATDYALLLTSRFREELRKHESRYEAMAAAWRNSASAVLASGMTVILALLCLLVSDLNSTRSLGPIGAIGIAFSILSALTLLPALLTLLGRTAFWPNRPHHGTSHPEDSGVWARLAGLISRHPRRLWLGTGGLLLVAACFLPTLNAGGTSQSDLFLSQVPSVEGQKIADRHFPGGAGSPVIIIGPAAERDAMVRSAADSAQVSDAFPVAKNGSPADPDKRPATVDGLVQVQAVLKAPAESEPAIDAVRSLRERVHAAAPGAKIGGTTATTLDSQTTAERDRNLVIPIVLVVIALLLALLLRAVAAALLLLATVVLSFAATLGVSALVFNHIFGFPAADPSVPLFGFVFLVALGIDYNIFLMTRVREESHRHGTRDGVLRGLIATGGVITSAGVVLAATFSALAVIPLLFLAQVAFIVAFGVLLDTLVVRSILVPSLVFDIGHRVWWPSRFSREGREPSG